MIRRIEYKVGKEKGITPAKRQWAGMQFEDNATEVVFQIGALGIEKARYRIDFNSAGAGYQPGENLTPEVTESAETYGGIEIKRSIPKLVTQYGGEVQVTAVITVLDESDNETGVCYSYPAIIYFTDVEKDAEGSLEVEKNISAAEASALAAATRAEQAAREAAESEEAAELALEKTEEARFALEEGAEFIFLGGDSTGSAEVELVIDDELSAASTNPVQNRVITTALNNFRRKRYLLIGDSYGQGSRAEVGIKGWAPLFKEKMDLSDNDCIINTLGGTGFVKGVDQSDGVEVESGCAFDDEVNNKCKFIDLLSYTATMVETNEHRTLSVKNAFPVSNPETITDIIVCGGYNDKANNSGVIAEAINNFVVKAKKLYPNAAVSIGAIGCAGMINNTDGSKYSSSTAEQLAKNSFQGYAGLVSPCKYPYRYLNNVEYALKVSPSYMYADYDKGEKGINDGVHPSQKGYTALANAITKAVEGGFAPGCSSYNAPLSALDTVDATSNIPGAVVKINNSVAEIYLREHTFVFNNTKTVDAHTLIELAEFDHTKSLISGSSDYTSFTTVSGHYKEQDSDKYSSFNGVVGIKDGKLCLMINALNSTNTDWGKNIALHILTIYATHIATATNIY